MVTHSPGLANARAAVGRRPRAVFTIVQNEPVFLPLWLAYYGKHFDAADMYVLDHDSSDGSTRNCAPRAEVIPVHRDKSFDHEWLKATVEAFQASLLRAYETVLFAEVDEFVVADPARYAGLGAYIAALDGPAACCMGYNVVQYPDEPVLRFDAPILGQRRYWHASHRFSKRLLARVPLAWSVGFHEERHVPAARPDPGLCLIHLHRADVDYCWARHRSAASRNWNENDVRLRLGWEKRIADPEEFRHWFYHGTDLDEHPREEIPARFRELL